MVRRQSTISNLLALLLAALLAAVVVSAEYPNDTPIYWNFPDDGGWWSGKIIGYDADNEMYTIEWEDASVEYYDNTDQVDRMVANANNDPDFNSNSIPQYVDGTELSMKEDGVWYDGTIASFDSDKQLYTIEWSHTKGETEEIAPGAVLDQMVTDAQLTDDQVSDDAILEPGQSHSVPDDSACLHSAGTEVSYWDTEDQRWYDGAVTGCVGTDGFHPTTYEIQWQPDGEIENVVDPDIINQYVAYAQKDDDLPPGVYAKGTTVYKEFFGEGWWIGEIIHYENNVYTVRWIDDSSVDMFDAGDEMDQMVVDAQFIPNTDDDGTIKNGPVRPATAQAPPPATSSSSNKKSSPAGAVFLSLFIVAVVGALGFVGMKYRSKKLVEQARQESGLDAEPPIEDNITYRDEPDDSKVSKII
mmetsp:Transcript_38795/g.93904  ORF Transcript_38795/g.93904 Transcript_38795/m.93904 type:complete len:414 (-) Transcript_38795:181-1422(-)